MTNALIVIFGITMLYVSATSRVEAYIHALAVQGLILFLMVIIDLRHQNIWNLVFLCLETLAFKAVLIPLFLLYTVRRQELFREVEPYIPNFYSLVITSVIFALGFLLAYVNMGGHDNFRPVYFGVAMSTLVAGLFLILSRKKIITHVMGYIMMSNGIFLLTLSSMKEMPLIVNMGVLLDLFVGIFMLGLFAGRIGSVFEHTNVENLMNLKD
jgi:hydrogenase-4 component E